MRRYIFATRKGIEIFDVLQTLKQLDQSAAFLKGKLAQKTPLLAVGTQPSAREAVKNFSEKFGLSYVVERWLGGTLTNFKVISQRIKYYLQLKADQAAGQLDKYTKKERLKISEQIVKLSRVFSGMKAVTMLPEALIIIDVKEHDTAVREAKRLKIPIVGIASSDSDPDGVTYLIPANDNARSSVKWLLGYLEKKLTETPPSPLEPPPPLESLEPAPNQQHEVNNDKQRH